MTDRFLVDECCPREFAAALRSLGCDALHALEAFPAAGDGEIVKTAGEQDRIVVTFDYGFGDRVVHGAEVLPGLIIVRLPRLRPGDQADRLRAALGEVEDMRGWLTIVEQDRIRRRKL